MSLEIIIIIIIIIFFADVPLRLK